jgi:hypothetical protein
MIVFNLLLSILALLISVAVAAFLFARGEIFAAPPPTALPTFRIKGKVKITNDCDGQMNSIPAQVTVETELQDAAGGISIMGRDTINVVPDPAVAPNPVKIGTYDITVVWPGGLHSPPRNAVHWTSPIVRERPRGLPVCNAIACPAQGPCRDRVTQVNIPVAPIAMHDIEVVCACN